MKLTVILAPEEDGGYSVICPGLPGAISQGDSLQDALQNIGEAILGCLEVNRDHGLAEPEETPGSIAREIEACLNDRAEDPNGASATTRARRRLPLIPSSLRTGLRVPQDERERGG